MANQDPRPRKVVIVVSDDEWRALRVAAAEDDTTMQGWLTTVVLGAIQQRQTERGAPLRLSAKLDQSGSGTP